MGMSPRIKAKKGRLGVDGLAPVIFILEPRISTIRGFSVAASASFTLRGRAVDDLTGDLSSTISWSSNLDGALGTGASITASLTTVGQHTITATISDTGSPVAVLASTSVRVTVT